MQYYKQYLKENELQYKLWVDMDGVLTNFGKAISDIGVSFDELDKDPNGAWKKIDAAGVAFWGKMEWMNDGKSLWNYVNRYKPTILSSPSKDPSSKIGKNKWVDRELGSKIPRILIYKKLKQRHSGKNSILIDDHPGNIRRWESKGGIGILHINSRDTIEQLKELGL